MFAKPYKLKSNNTLKNTEKKQLSQRIKDEFPKTSDEKIKELVPAKSTCICMKLVLHTGVLVNVYSVDGVPVVIETEEGLVPTVCALWRVPDLVPVLSIHTPVLSKMQKGAPLYLPGVVIPTRGVGFPMFPRGAIVSLCTTDNAAACIVGRSAMSSADMLLRAAGVCVETLHILGDHLCKDVKFNKIERPTRGVATYGAGDVTDIMAGEVSQLSIQSAKEEWPSLGPPRGSPAESLASVPRVPSAPTVPSAPAVPSSGHVPNAPALIQEAHTEATDELDDTLDNSQLEDEVPTDMDALLTWCLLTFMKQEGKKVELPLKTNLLYKNYLLPVCPPDRTLDVKKSSYKKLGKFLEAMQQEGLVEVRELERGVDAVFSLSTQHALLTSHRAPPPPRRIAAAESREYVPPVVREVYCVTAPVAPVLLDYKKGTALTAAEVRASVSEYVRSRSLAGERGAVSLDHTLALIVGKNPQESVKWEVLMPCILNKMTASTLMQFSSGAVTLVRNKLEPVRMQVVNRSGNKKVTLVSNLESFGFSLVPLAAAAQRGVAASCGVTRAPGAKSDQLMLQGDQTHFVAKLLIEKYGLPKKFVEGADKALNKKK